MKQITQFFLEGESLTLRKEVQIIFSEWVPKIEGEYLKLKLKAGTLMASFVTSNLSKKV